MKIPLTYEEAKQRHPREVAAAVRALRASISIQKATAPSKLDWYYTIAVRIDSKAPLTIGGFRPPRKPSKRPLEEQVHDQLSRSRAFLHASVGRWSHNAPLTTLPPEWERHTRDELGKIFAERAAYEALPASERGFREDEAKTAKWSRNNGSLKKPE